MKIKLLSIIMILICIFMVGCQNPQNNQSEQSYKSSSTTSNEKSNNESSGSNKTNNIAKSNNVSQSNSTSNKSISNESNNGSTNKSNESTSTLKLLDYLKAPNEISLKGKLNNSDIHITLHKSNVNLPKYSDNPEKYSDNVITTDYSRYSEEGIIQDTIYEGSYYYDKIKKDIKVIGVLYQGGLFEITEYDINNNINAFFKGYVNSDYISGLWSEGKTPEKAPFSIKEYSFYLISNSSKSENIKFSSIISDIQGVYTNKLSDETFSSNIVIFNKTNNGFQFAIDSHSSSNVGVNIGSVGGTAIYTDNNKSKAQYTNKNDGLSITFDLSNNTIVVTANDSIQKYGASNVSLTGTFVKQSITK